MHLDDRADRQNDVKSPGAYLMRIAMNMAFDRVQRERRYMSDDEIDALMTEFVDPTPGPAQTVEARDEIALLERLLATMPPRRRAIFIAVRGCTRCPTRMWRAVSACLRVWSVSSSSVLTSTAWPICRGPNEQRIADGVRENRLME